MTLTSDLTEKNPTLWSNTVNTFLTFLHMRALRGHACVYTRTHTCMPRMPYGDVAASRVCQSIAITRAIWQNPIIFLFQPESSVQRVPCRQTCTRIRKYTYANRDRVAHSNRTAIVCRRICGRRWRNDFRATTVQGSFAASGRKIHVGGIWISRYILDTKRVIRPKRASPFFPSGSVTTSADITGSE